ncbi:type I secretion protein TolC [Hypericibacter terrae]|uniref:Type I secretion protein TolC n=1 Tax=Hypericibacter terrae TaxID=2602015 RepID=A0A5J6MVD6_9PROT|nr:TolC family outer membrane protein [Hypericibacter terrae]QEX18726.1 type I secretion protein TolC [Hypericibacter terrae]
MPSRRARLSRPAVRSLSGLLSMAFALLLATGPSHPAFAADTLLDALAKAYNNNPQLQAARAQLRATDEGVPQAKSGWRPTVTATGDVGEAWANNYPGLQSPSDYQPRGVDLEVTQPLYTGERTPSALRQAESLVLAQRSVLTSAEQTVLQSAVTAYMNVVQAVAVLELNTNQEAVIRRDLEATRTRFEVGELTKTDVAQAEASLAGATAARIQSEGLLAAARAAYANVIGENPGTLVQPPPLTGLPASQEEVVAGSEDAPTVTAAKYNEQAAHDGIDVAFSQIMPFLNIVGTAGMSDDANAANTGRNSASIMLQLTVPLYQAGLPAADVRQSKQVAAQRRQELENERRFAIQTAVQSWSALQTARAQISSFVEQVRANKVALEGVRLEANVGARTVLDILDAEQAYLNSQVSLVTAQRDEVVAAYAVEAAVGRLTARDLALPVEYYDVEAYYNEVHDKFWGFGTKTQ